MELPLGATEDRICGTIDIEKALSEGVKAYEPGLLVCTASHTAQHPPPPPSGVLERQFSPPACCGLFATARFPRLASHVVHATPSPI